MNKRVPLIPSGLKLIKLSLFYWVTYTLSVIVFTLIATLLYLLGFSEAVYFITAFSLSSLLLVGMYIRRLYRLEKNLERRIIETKQDETLASQRLQANPNFSSWKISSQNFSNRLRSAITQIR